MCSKEGPCLGMEGISSCSIWVRKQHSTSAALSLTALCAGLLSQDGGETRSILSKLRKAVQRDSLDATELQALVESLHSTLATFESP